MQVELSPDEALYCLEGIACAIEESWAPELAKSSSEDLDSGALIRKLAAVAGIDPEQEYFLRSGSNFP